MTPLIIGISLHAVGASFAALCYTPQKKTVAWSWQTYWLAQAAVCWLLMPVLGAWLSTPHLGTVLSEAPKEAMLWCFLMGMAYGIGGTAFGIAIRYVGYSLTYALSVGLSCVLGTLLPPLVAGKLGDILYGNGSSWVLTGILAGVAGIALCGIAGRYKETDIATRHINSAANKAFSLSKGLPLCILAGILSAVYGFAIVQGQPIADVAAKYGAGNFQGNVIYLFTNSGAFVSTLVYCVYLHKRHHTFGEYRRVMTARGKVSTPGLYFIMAALTGVLWYGQFFFYAWAHRHMGNYKFTSWAIHMIMLVLFSSVAGLAMREWTGCNRKTINLLATALTVLIAAVLILTYGNYLGGGE